MSLDREGKFVDDKKTMTLNLSYREMSLLEQLAEKKGMSKSALLRQALRLYSSLEERFEQGDKIFLENSMSREKSEIMML